MPAGRCRESALFPWTRRAIERHYSVRRFHSLQRTPKLARYNRALKLALIGYGNVGRALAKLIEAKRRDFPFTITGIHTLRHGTAIDPAGVKHAATFGPRAASVDEFLEDAKADIAVELTTLNPHDGEPAISHIRAAMARGMHVV